MVSVNQNNGLVRCEGWIKQYHYLNKDVHVRFFFLDLDKPNARLKSKLSTHSRHSTALHHKCFLVRPCAHPVFVLKQHILIWTVETLFSRQMYFMYSTKNENCNFETSSRMAEVNEIDNQPPTQPKPSREQKIPFIYGCA